MLWAESVDQADRLTRIESVRAKKSNLLVGMRQRLKIQNRLCAEDAKGVDRHLCDWPEAHFSLQMNNSVTLLEVGTCSGQTIGKVRESP